MKIKLSIKSVKQLSPQSRPYEARDTDIKGFLLRVQPTGIMTYYLVYKVAGIKKRYKIGNHGSLNAIQARDIALKLSVKYLSGTDLQAEKKEKKLVAEKNLKSTLRNFLDTQYNSWVIAQNKTGSDSVKRILINFKDFLDIPLSEINSAKVEHWRSEKINNGKKTSTVNRDINALSSCLSKAVQWEIIPSHPLSKLKKLKTDDNCCIRYLSENEEQELRTALIEREAKIKKQRNNGNSWREIRGHLLLPSLSDITFCDHLQPMILLSINTGIRQGELFSLKWENINFDRAILTIDGSNAKSKKTRHIPLNREALSALREWRNQTSADEFVFSSKDGNRFNNVRKSWDSLLTKASIHNFRWHDLRHHFASKLAMAGVDLNTIRELLGHSDLTMTLRYAHLAPEHKAAAVAKLDNFSHCH